MHLQPIWLSQDIYNVPVPTYLVDELDATGMNGEAGQDSKYSPLLLRHAGNVRQCDGIQHRTNRQCS
jgi:hypothetical protein